MLAELSDEMPSDGAGGGARGAAGGGAGARAGGGSKKTDPARTASAKFVQNCGNNRNAGQSRKNKAVGSGRTEQGRWVSVSRAEGGRAGQSRAEQGRAGQELWHHQQAIDSIIFPRISVRFH